MKVSDLEDILLKLSARDVARLANKLNVDRPNKSERAHAIAARHARAPQVLIDALRASDLVECLRACVITTEFGEYGLSNISKRTLPELRAVARRLWVDGWTPYRDEEVVLHGLPVTAFRLYQELDLGLGAYAAIDDSFDESAETQPARDDEISTALAADAKASFGLANFQMEAVHAIRRKLAGRSGRRALLCLPTGGGKTMTALHLLLHDYVAANKKVLWVTHRIDLLDQVHEDIKRSAWQLSRSRATIRVSRIQQGVAGTGGDFILASAMSLVKNEAMLGELNADRSIAIIVYDEAHRLVASNTWNAINLLLRGGRALLGLTATPYRTDRAETERLTRVLGHPTYFRSFADLLREGFLAKPVFFHQSMRSTKAMRLSEQEVERSRTSGDFAPSVIARLARNRDRDHEIVLHWKSREQMYGKTLAFACDIEHAEALALAFARQGVRAEAIHSRKDDDDRRAMIESFKAGSIDVLVNVGIMTEGTNVPDIRTVLLTRPTLSRSLYMQMIGRGARGPNSVEGKTSFCVIDCVDNFQVHGFSSAGADVARELGLGDEQADDSERAVTPTASNAGGEGDARDARRRSRLRRLDAALRLLESGFLPTAYTFAGELRWGGDSTLQYRDAAVFSETQGLLEDALQRLKSVLNRSSIDKIYALSGGLAGAGALRADQWHEIVTWSLTTGSLPVIVPVPEDIFSEQEISVVSTIETLARKCPNWGESDWHQFLLSNDGLRGELEFAFDDVAVVARLIAAIGARFASAEEPQDIAMIAHDERRDLARDAQDFSAIASAMLEASDVDAVVEHRVIETSCRLLFGFDPVRADQPLGSSDDDVREAAMHLGQGASVERCTEIMDHLLRVVRADGSVTDRERHVLRLVAPHLAFPLERLDDRLASIELVPTDTNVDLGKHAACVSCYVCNEVLPVDSAFCGACGTCLLPMSSDAFDHPPDAGSSLTCGMQGGASTTFPTPGTKGEGSEESQSTGGGAESLRETGGAEDARSAGGDEDAEKEAAEAARDEGVSVCGGCGARWPAESRFCGACALPLATGHPRQYSPKGRSSGQEATQAANHSRPRNTSSGYAAERWLHQQLEAVIGSAGLDRNVARYGRGQSDFVVRRASEEFHIELKHVAAVDGELHWSFDQVELWRMLRGDNVPSYMVVAVSSAEHEYDLYWCEDPCTMLASAARTVEYRYTFDAPAAQGAGADPWAVATDSSRHLHCSPKVHFWIKIDRDVLQAMTHRRGSDGPVQPVLDWLARYGDGNRG